MNNKLKMFLDVAPLAIFFVAYKFAGVIAATGLLTASTMTSLAITYWITRKIALAPLVTGVIVAIFGTLTIVLHDDFFIKIKPTLVNLIFATLLLGGLYFKKIVLKHVMESAISLDESGWQKLSMRYGLFFVFLAGLNEVIWRNFSTDFWVNFKVFGMFSITILFTMLQTRLIKKHQLVAVEIAVDN
jgi:intracellular septation protein